MRKRVASPSTRSPQPRTLLFFSCLPTRMSVCCASWSISTERPHCSTLCAENSPPLVPRGSSVRVAWLPGSATWQICVEDHPGLSVRKQYRRHSPQGACQRWVTEGDLVTTEYLCAGTWRFLLSTAPRWRQL